MWTGSPLAQSSGVDICLWDVHPAGEMLPRHYIQRQLTSVPDLRFLHSLKWWNQSFPKTISVVLCRSAFTWWWGFLSITFCSSFTLAEDTASHFPSLRVLRLHWTIFQVLMLASHASSLDPYKFLYSTVFGLFTNTFNWAQIHVVRTVLTG